MEGKFLSKKENDLQEASIDLKISENYQTKNNAEETS